MNARGQSIVSKVLALGLVVLLAACESTRPAPVIDRGSAATSAPATRRAGVAPAPRTPANTVVTTPATAAVPPAPTGIQINAIDASESIEARPIDARPPSLAGAPTLAAGSEASPRSAGGAAQGAVRTEPRGYKLPWSEENLARLRGTVARPEAKAAAGASATPASPPPASPPPAPAAAAAASSPERVAEALADRPDFAWPAKGRVIERFEGNSRGIGIAANEGDAVQAAASGTVLYAGSGIRGYGQLLIVKHNDSYISVYAHNSRLLVKQGDAVRSGQKIAEVGHTDASRSKLHFEIRRQGTSVDPLTLLPARD